MNYNWWHRHYDNYIITLPELKTLFWRKLFLILALQRKVELLRSLKGCVPFKLLFLAGILVQGGVPLRIYRTTIYIFYDHISLATIAATHFCNLFNEIVVARFKVRFVREISERCFVITIEILRVLSQLRIIFKFCF